LTQRNCTRRDAWLRNARFIREPLKAVSEVHPLAADAAKLADAAYLGRDLRLLTPDVCLLLLTLEPIIVVGSTNKWRRVAGHRSYQVVRQLISDSEHIPILAYGGRVPKELILQLSMCDVFVRRLLTSLDATGTHQLDAMAEALIPCYRRSAPGRPAAANEYTPIAVEELFRERLSTERLARILGIPTSTLRKARQGGRRNADG
jgi:hypothetical protein